MNTQNTEKFIRNNFVIWVSIVLGMGVMCIVTFALYISQTFTPIQEVTQIKNVLFLMAIILAVGILFLKRSFFATHTIVDKIRTSTIENHEHFLLRRLRKNYIILWILGEMILILGFIEFVLIADFNSFLIYAVVGLYAVLINFPRKTLVAKSLELLSQNRT